MIRMLLDSAGEKSCIYKEKKWDNYQVYISKLNVKKGVDLLITNQNTLSELYERFELI